MCRYLSFYKISAKGMVNKKMRKENRRKSKSKRIKIIIVTCTIFLIIFTSSVYAYDVNSYNNSINNGKQLLKEDKFDSSIASYKKAQSTVFGKRHSKEINDSINLVNKVKNSKQSYDQGMQLYKDKKYIEAMDSLKKVAKEDGKRYIDSNNKIKEAKNLYIAENIENAKNEANNKKYDSAINFLNAVLKLDNTNNEANQLKDEYDSQIKKQKEDEETKARELQEAEQLKKETAQKTNSTSSSNSSAQKNTSTTTSSNKQKSSNPSTDSNSKTEQSSNSTANSSETVTANNGWFSIKREVEKFAPTPGFGIISMSCGPDPFGIYFNFVQGVAGDAVNYRITFRLKGRDVSFNGTASNSNEMNLVSTSFSEVPKGYNVKIDVSAVYKGKTYNDTFYKVLNDRY